MAVTIPVLPVPLDPSSFQARRPTLSGQAAADQPFGVLGLIGQANHAYANRVQVVSSWSPWNADTVWRWSEAGGVLLTITGSEPLEAGAHVAALTLTTDSEDALVYLRTSEGNVGFTSSTGRQKKTVGVAVTDKTGIPLYVYLQLRRRAAGVTGKLYRYCIEETILVPGDFP